MHYCLEAPLSCYYPLHYDYTDLALTVMASMVAKRLGRLTANTTYFFLCDMQEKFRPTIKYYPEIITVASKMVSKCSI